MNPYVSITHNIFWIYQSFEWTIKYAIERIDSIRSNIDNTYSIAKIYFNQYTVQYSKAKMPNYYDLKINHHEYIHIDSLVYQWKIFYEIYLMNIILQKVYVAINIRYTIQYTIQYSNIKRKNI